MRKGLAIAALSSLCMLLNMSATRAQLSVSDFKQLGNDVWKELEDSTNTMHPLKVQKGALNPVFWALREAMRGYQIMLSPYIYGDCPYDLSCSNFSKQSIYHFGMVKGILLSADRLSRCNHLSLGDYHKMRVISGEKIIDLPGFYK